MESKKNPKYDLRHNSSLYFVIGLALILFIVWRAIEWKSYEKNTYDYEQLDVTDDDEEEVPITEQIKTPPPPPPSAPEVIEVVEDDEEVEETIIESTETDQEEIIEEVVVEEIEEEVDVPFAIIEDAPIWPGCEKRPKSARRNCFEEQIKSTSRKIFATPKSLKKWAFKVGFL